MGDGMKVWPALCRYCTCKCRYMQYWFADSASGKMPNRLQLPICMTTGDSKSGKTTLTAVLEKVLQSGGSSGMVENIKELTAGIIPTRCLRAW